MDKKHYDANILFYWDTPNESSSEGKWTHLKAQGGRFVKGHFGPEITFARKLLGSGYHPAIFKFAIPSTSLVNNWKEPGAGGLYDLMVEELKASIEELKSQGHTVKFGALVWIQGETDSEHKELSHVYGDKLRILINNFRHNVANNPNLPIILGVDESWASNLSRDGF